MNGAARFLVRLVGFKDVAVEQGHSEDDTKMGKSMQNIFSFDEKACEGYHGAEDADDHIDGSRKHRRCTGECQRA